MSLLAANSIAIAFFSADVSSFDNGAMTPASASAVEPDTVAGAALDAVAAETPPIDSDNARISLPNFILASWGLPGRVDASTTRHHEL